MSEKKPLISGRESSDLEAEVAAELAQGLGDMSVEELMERSAQPESQATPTDGEAGPAETEETIELRLVRGRITAIEGDDVFVQLAGMLGRNQGVVPLTQFDRPPRVGSIMDFVLDRMDEAQGLAHLSREGAISALTWDQLHVGSVVEARVTGANKGGLELEMVGGIRAFMPASQIDLHHVDDLEQFVGQKLPGRVQEINRKGKKVLLSRRQHLEHERELKKRKLWEELEVGQVREGRVSSVVDYGAFVDLGGVDGLVHVSDLSYTRVDKPSEVIKQGDHVKVKVLKLDRERERISLGLKQVEPDPWQDVDQRIKPGEHLTARVVRVADFGVFVEVEPGVEGLVPQSELTWRRHEKPGSVAKEGDMLHLQVLQVEANRHRISLSLKQAQGDPWTGAERKFPVHSLVEASVQSLTDFGAFVEVEKGIEGLVHISELSNRRVQSVGEVLKVGQQAKFRVLEVDEEHRRMRLSLKAAEEGPAPAAAAQAPAKAVRPQIRKPTRPLKGGLE